MPDARILVIDDEANIRETLRLALETEGYVVETAADGPEGLGKFGTGEGWDLVLLDQRMPALEGTEVLRRLYDTNHSVPVILLTAYGSINLTAEVLGAGARAFLTKPITPAQLRDVVGRILASSAHGTAAREAQKRMEPR